MAQWKFEDGMLVSDHGDYWISGADLAHRDGHGDYDLLHHLLRKNWVNPATIVPAFKSALQEIGEFNASQWETTMQNVRVNAYRKLCWAEAKRRIGPSTTDHRGFVDMGKESEIDHLANELAGFGWDGRVVAAD